MYYSEETLEKDLKAQGYKKIERKPWNVRENDVIILSQYGMGFLNSGWMPAVVTHSDDYPEFNNPYPYDRTSISRTTYRLYHKPLHPKADGHRMSSWHSTSYYSTDTVEIWRRK